MSKLNVFAIFGVLFLSSVLLGSGLYSNSVSIYAQENEAEVEADIEQENKCKKDSDCENENEINNSLNITNITQTQQQTEESVGPEPETCQECFYKFLTLEQFDALFGSAITLEDFCRLLLNPGVGQPLSESAFIVDLIDAGLSQEEAENFVDCLENIGGIFFP